MPELPEVETTVQGLNRLIEGDTIIKMRIYDDRLRWPVDHGIVQKSKSTRIGQLWRRSKYLLIPLYPPNKHEPQGHIMIHLGMSGRLQLVGQNIPREKHSHIDWYLKSGQILRYTDPRRFGSVHWCNQHADHALLAKLGPEPLENGFNSQYLFEKAQNRTQAIKVFIMNASIVVGVGNIYASESLFTAGIHPQRSAGSITREEMSALVKAIKQVLKKAIKAGGTTLKDFKGGDGKPGYFKQELLVYGRENEPCLRCTTPIAKIVLGQRASFYCRQCQI